MLTVAGAPRGSQRSIIFVGAVYPGPGPDPSKDALLTDCPSLSKDIPRGQAFRKKILLSIGGRVGEYSVTGEQEGTEFAGFLWDAFGPQTQEWLNAGKPRPFDGPNGEEV